jgi:transcriptional regulator with XRE-family HTH domain
VRIRLLRARHGWRQSEVADRLGISQQAYAKLERPGANPELNTLVRVERALEAPLLEYA